MGSVRMPQGADRAGGAARRAGAETGGCPACTGRAPPVHPPCRRSAVSPRGARRSGGAPRQAPAGPSSGRVATGYRGGRCAGRAVCRLHGRDASGGGIWAKKKGRGRFGAARCAGFGGRAVCRAGLARGGCGTEGRHGGCGVGDGGGSSCLLRAVILRAVGNGFRRAGRGDPGAPLVKPLRGPPRGALPRDGGCGARHWRGRRQRGASGGRI